MTLTVRPIALRDANAWVMAHHRHHGQSTGHRFSLAAYEGDALRGVAIVGRPVAREFDPDRVAEVTRVCTDGARNACSLLYGAARRVCKAMGFERLITYTLESESGASLKASGFQRVCVVPGRGWSCPSRPREDRHPLENKIRWEIVL